MKQPLQLSQRHADLITPAVNPARAAETRVITLRPEGIPAPSMNPVATECAPCGRCEQWLRNNGRLTPP